MTIEQARYELSIPTPASMEGTPEREAEDDAIQGKIEAATAWCEKEVGRTFRETASRTMLLRDLPRVISFWHPPLLSVSSVTYLDAEQQSQTIEPTEYRVIQTSESKGVLSFNSDADLPTEVSDQLDRYRITYLSGYESKDKYPPAAVQAAKLMLVKLWDYDETPAHLAGYEEAAKGMLSGLEWGGYQ